MSDSSRALALLLGEQPPRADAERNVAALLAATRELVLAGDLNPTAAQIASTAGVGVGTLYRRALSKEALLAAAVIDLLEGICETADAPQSSESWDGFEQFAINYLRIREITCSLTHVLEEEFDGGVGAAKERTRAAFTRLTQRLHEAGYLDDAVDAAELMVILASIDVTEDTLGLAPNNARRKRVIKRMLGALRA